MSDEEVKFEKAVMIRCPIEDKEYDEKEFMFQTQAGYNICMHCGGVFYPPRSLEILKRGVEEERRRKESSIVVVKDTMLNPK
jgi:hypothetical protein